ncbi:ankyrin unc44 [Grosmannia clavigera kw1407]|uniref:Ankyrin unc44 n=1 Tax=Grosmannia clavigera (strain kw1407 / UAMH 11150) TaxID=655863 RepID=F0XSV1_GROCL|nr:ankyrin unc44 [Grosmannia clavigera kw1407]EFW99114.1 ankyrin unc44 [Grosmannia clavigera kw1407]
MLGDLHSLLVFASEVYDQYKTLGREATELKRRVKILTRLLKSYNVMVGNADRSNLLGPGEIATMRTMCRSLRKALEQADEFVKRLKRHVKAMMALINSPACRILLETLTTRSTELTGFAVILNLCILLESKKESRVYERVKAANIPSSALDFTRDLLMSGKYIDLTFPNGNTSLHYACRAGDLPLVRLLLRNQADPGKMTNDLQNSLHLAAAKGRIDILTAILAHVADYRPTEMTVLLEQVDGHQNTLLHAALQAKSLSTIEFVTKQLADAGCTNTINAGGWIARRLLRTAKQVKIAKILAILLEAKASIIDNRGEGAVTGRTVLHTAVKEQKPYAVKALLVAVPSLKDARDSAGQTALELAVESGQVAITKALLKAGSPIQTHKKADTTLLHMAAKTGNERAALTLLHAGFPGLNAQDSTGRTALYMAAERGHVEVERALLEHRASIRIGRFEDSKTALHVAVENNHVDAVRALITRRATIIDICDNSEKTALHVAAARGFVRIAKLLVAGRSTVVNARTATGKTALHIAAAKDRPGVIDVLVDAGASLKLLDENGRSAKDMAKNKNNWAAMAALAKAKQEREKERKERARSSHS